MLPGDYSKRGSLFILSAPSGTGKTVLVDRLTAEFPSVVRSISFTTRPPRENEKDGVDYFFVSEEDFSKRVERGEFLEHVQLYGKAYGTSRPWVEGELNAGRHVVLVIDTQGAMQLKGQVDAVYIFVMPPSFEELKNRLERRSTESEEGIEGRLKWAVEEVNFCREYDYLVTNDDLETAYQVLKSIVIAEEHRIKKE